MLPRANLVLTFTLTPARTPALTLPRPPYPVSTRGRSLAGCTRHPEVSSSSRTRSLALTLALTLTLTLTLPLTLTLTRV